MQSVLSYLSRIENYWWCIRRNGSFFKRGSDGTQVIRVDDPNDVIFASELPRPKTALEFKEEATKLY